MERLFWLIASRLRCRALPTLSPPSQEAYHCSCPPALGLPVSKGNLPTTSKEYVGSSAAPPCPEAPRGIQSSHASWAAARRKGEQSASPSPHEGSPTPHTRPRSRPLQCELTRPPQAYGEHFLIGSHIPWLAFEILDMRVYQCSQIKVIMKK